jgi:hypothetical protein
MPDAQNPVAGREGPLPVGYPLPPEPFDMGEWRKAWAAWWSQANREAINAAMRRMG